MQTPRQPFQAATLHEVKRAHVLAVLAASDGNRTLAARTLRVDRKTLNRMLRRWGATEEAQPADPEATLR